MGTSNVLFLVKFYVPVKRDDLVPYGLVRIDEKQATNHKHFNQLKRLGLGELAQFGRHRENKQDSGENIACPAMASAPSFLKTMKEQGLKIISARRFADKKNEKRCIVQLGIGFAEESITLNRNDQAAIDALFKTVWQNCFVWDNSAPRKAGVESVDTINFTGCLEAGATMRYELYVNEDGNLMVSPFDPTAGSLPLTPDAGRVATEAA